MCHMKNRKRNLTPKPLWKMAPSGQHGSWTNHLKHQTPQTRSTCRLQQRYSKNRGTSGRLNNCCTTVQ
eukprot:8834729-Prorocentrum_lima.AAC.1